MAGELIINKALDFLLEWGLVFLVLLIIYEGLKLIFGMRTAEEPLIGAKERALGRAAGGVGGVGKALGGELKKGGREMLRRAGLVAKDISDIKRDIQTQETMLRHAFNQINNVYESLEKMQNPAISFTAAELNNLATAKQKIKDWVNDVKEYNKYDAGVIDKIKEHFNYITTHNKQLKKTADSETDTAKKQIINSVYGQVQSFILNETKFWQAVYNFQNKLNNLPSLWKTVKGKKTANKKVADFIKKQFGPTRTALASSLNELEKLKAALI